MAQLKTRKPTGQVAWPLVLIEGAEKVGKSYTAFSFSTDERVGRTFVFELGEAKADEYARLGPYEVVEHNGTFSDIYDQLEAACAEPRTEGRPNVVVFDQITSLWELIKDWTETRARNSRAGRAALAEDPDAEIDIPMNLWNDAKQRWYKVINLLRRSDVIGVLVARGAEVTKVQNGRPVTGQTEYRIEAEKSTVFAVTAEVRIGADHSATLVAVNSLDAEVPARGLRLDDQAPLGQLVFDILGCGVETGPQRITHGSVGLSIAEAKQRVLDLVTRMGNEDGDAAKATAGRLWGRYVPGKPEEISPDDLTVVIDKAAAWLERSTKPVGVRDIAIRAGEVFAAHADTVKGHKVIDGLRHALVLELTSGKSLSSNDLKPAQLRALATWLDDVEDDQIKVSVDDNGVEFTWADGSTSSFSWADLEPIDGKAAKEAFDEALRTTEKAS